MVAAKITSVGSCLIEVGLRGQRLALQLDHGHRTTHEKDSVGPSRLKRKLIFENGDVPSGIAIAGNDLPDLTLQGRD